MSEQMLVSMLSVTVEARDKSCPEPALALGPLCGDLNPEDLLIPFLLMGDLKN